jgi:hypothetical protein
MLSPNEFSIGYIGSVTELTLVLPIESYDRACLITAAPGKPMAIVIDERDLFASFESEGNTSWKGLLVPNVVIEIDETSIFDADGWSLPCGALVRQEDKLFVSVSPDGRLQRARVPLLANLPTSDPRMKAGFKRWQISLGNGLSKRILKTFDTDLLNKPRS